MITKKLESFEIIPLDLDLNKIKLAKLIYMHEMGINFLPIPLKEEENIYQQLDGLHRMIYHGLKEEPPNVVIIESLTDLFQLRDYPSINHRQIRKANTYIESNWNPQFHIERKHESFDKYFEKLQEKYNFLKDYETCKKYFTDNGWLKTIYDLKLVD